VSKDKNSEKRFAAAAKQAIRTEVEERLPKERPRWPKLGDRIILLAPHRRAGETAAVVGFDKPSDLPGEETLPRVRFADGREMLVHEPQSWTRA
jgi:hypothetical protein